MSVQGPKRVRREPGCIAVLLAPPFTIQVEFEEDNFSLPGGVGLAANWFVCRIGFVWTVTSVTTLFFDSRAVVHVATGFTATPCSPDRVVYTPAIGDADLSYNDGELFLPFRYPFPFP